jgi:hypothetical protein
VAVVQYTLTHKQYIEQHNRHKQYVEQHSSLIRKSADRAPSLRGITLAFALQLRKKQGKISVRVAGECNRANFGLPVRILMFRERETEFYNLRTCEY